MDLAPKSTEPNPAVNREQPGLPFETAQGENSSANEMSVAGAANPASEVPKRIIWLHRISLVIFVIFCIELGMLLPTATSGCISVATAVADATALCTAAGA